MTRPDPTDPVLCRLDPSPVRRLLGLAILGLLAALLLWLGLRHPPTVMALRLFLLVLGGVALWLALRFWQATSVGLVLTAAGLSETGGRVLARIEDMAAIHRGALAAKPSQGFSVTLHRRVGKPVWAPGLWWRMGRRLGVGGVTSRHDARLMAERLADLIAARANRPDPETTGP
jgi:hypothetical protein